ncbi:MAG: MgtC/SapB transporter [Hyphomicrobiales bacterium]|nr:MgtC/SapB transporter [Hyphomicrobiales bacterium]
MDIAWDNPWVRSTLVLGAATLAGGLIGLNRVLNAKPAGVRVHALVSLSCALLVLTSEGMASPEHVSRVIQGILAGIGFLGAGIILREMNAGTRHRIFHLTTAASVWAAAAVGVACGLGAWIPTLVGTAMMLAVLAGAIRIDRAFFGRFGDEDDRGDPIA